MKKRYTPLIVSPFLVFPSLRISVSYVEIQAAGSSVRGLQSRRFRAAREYARAMQERCKSERAIRLQGIVSFALGCVRRADMVPLVVCLGGSVR